MLIVDDDRLDREGLSAQLDWKKYLIDEVFMASNGPAALEILQKHDIDIMFTDAKMPVMSGVELAQRVKQIKPSIKAVIISGYDDFEFMKSAIRADAYDYILKPVHTQELEACVINVVDSVLGDKQEQNEKNMLLNMASAGVPLLRQKLMLDLLYGMSNNLEDRIKELDIPLNTGCMVVLLIETDDYQLYAHRNYQKVKELWEIINGMNPREQYRFDPVLIDDGRLAVVVSTCGHLGFGEETEKAVVSLAEEILNIVTPICNVTIGVGGVVNSYRELKESYNMSVEAILSKLYNGTERILPYVDYREKSDKHHLFQTSDLEIADCLNKLDLPKAIYLLNYMFDCFEQQNGSNLNTVQYHCINIVSRMEITLRDFNVSIDDLFGKKINLIEKLLKFEDILNIRQWMINVLRAAIEHLDVKRKSNASIIVKEVIAYVESNYKEEISLNIIAKCLFYSPNYLGNIFKQETGKYFSEYLTKYRIKKSAELLQDRKIKIKEVSLAVGYKDMPTFIKNFKSVYGITPSEYRARNAE